MVRLRPESPLSSVATGALGVVGILLLYVGFRLVARAETFFGAVGYACLPVAALVLVLSASVLLFHRHPRVVPGTVMFEGEPATGLLRRGGWAGVVVVLNLSLVGTWFLAVGVVGTIVETWAWLMLTVVPAAYFLGFPVLMALGRFRIGGTWFTEDRVVDVHFGLRSELALRDVSRVSAVGEAVRLIPREGAAVTHRSFAPPWWRARRYPELRIPHRGWPGGAPALADEVRGWIGHPRR